MTTTDVQRMIDILQMHTTENERREYLRFLCRNHNYLQETLRSYQNDLITHKEFVAKFREFAKPSLRCLHALLEQNFNADQVLFRIFPRVDIPYVRVLAMFSKWECKRTLREMVRKEGKGKDQCLLSIKGKLEELEREEGTWNFAREGEMW